MELRHYSLAGSQSFLKAHAEGLFVEFQEGFGNAGEHGLLGVFLAYLAGQGDHGAQGNDVGDDLAAHVVLGGVDDREGNRG